MAEKFKMADYLQKNHDFLVTNLTFEYANSNGGCIQDGVEYFSSK
jgi:hypothetical protein